MDRIKVPQVIILAIDPSTTSLGWAYNPVWTGEIVAPTKLPRPQRLNVMWTGLTHVFAQTKVDLVVYYRPFTRGDDATRCQWGVVGIVEALAIQAGAAVTDVSEAKVRSHYGISSKLPKGARRRDELKEKALAAAREIGYSLSSIDEAEAALLVEYTRANAKRLPK